MIITQKDGNDRFDDGSTCDRKTGNQEFSRQVSEICFLGQSKQRLRTKFSVKTK